MELHLRPRRIYCHGSNGGTQRREAPLDEILHGLSIALPTTSTPQPPPGTPPPSPPPSPRGGDSFGSSRKGKVPNWGRSDKASRERARKARWDKVRRNFEREAFASSHPQECPVCLDRPKTHLLYKCELDQEPFHRGHGLCGECARAILDTTSKCPLCNLHVEGIIAVGTESFV